MAAIDYPTGLPTPLQAEYGLEHVDTVLRTQMASGRTRERKRFTSAPSRVNVQWLMRSGQAQLFEAWYWAAYNPDDPQTGGIDGGTMPFNIRLKTPIGLRTYEDVKFDGLYQGPTLVGGSYWRITATLRIAKRPVLDASWLEFPDYVLDSDIFDRAMNSKWPPQN